MIWKVAQAIGVAAVCAAAAVAQENGAAEGEAAMVRGDQSAPVVQAAYDCITAYLPQVARTEENLGAAVNFLTSFVCQEEVGRASLYRQNAFLVDEFAERLQQRLEKTIDVDPDTGELITDLTVEQAAGLGYQDWSALQNELSAQAQGPQRYLGSDPIFSTFAARALLDARTKPGTNGAALRAAE